jgi:SpoVK/Ycf46/Vps4 family AAA+-type ATPase
MTVNALAYELKKKVLLVDFGSLYNRKDGSGDLDADLKGLFREAHMNNAILFFDECETVFKSRNSGGDRLLNSLLTEIERHEGMVFLATNRPYEMDEAMHRRITMVIEYRSPTLEMRIAIWKILLGVNTNTATNENSNGNTIQNTNIDINNYNNELIMHKYDNIKQININPSTSTSSLLLTNTLNDTTYINGYNNTTTTITNDSTVPLFLKPETSSNESTNESKNEIEVGLSKPLKLHDDVNLCELAVKYELTGGFIKVI